MSRVLAAVVTGAMAVQVVVELQVAVTDFVPKLTVVLPITKLVPVTVTTVPPAIEPEEGLILVTVGVGRLLTVIVCWTWAAAL